MSKNNGWPGQPGVPLNPERDGWHWVCAAVGIAAPYPMLWCADGKAWDTGDGWEFCTSLRMTERTRYLGPCLTPAERDALRLDVEAMRPLSLQCDRLAAENARLREALERLARLGAEPYYGNSDGNMIARAALGEKK